MALEGYDLVMLGILAAAALLGTQRRAGLMAKIPEVTAVRDATDHGKKEAAAVPANADTERLIKCRRLRWFKTRAPS